MDLMVIGATIGTIALLDALIPPITGKVHLYL